MANKAAVTSVRQGFALTLAVFGTLFAVTLGAQLPVRWTPSWLKAQRIPYTEVWPQHWAFFASQPDAAVFSAYRNDPPGVASSALAPQMSAANLWGLGSTSTVEFNEVRTLTGEIPERDWISCPDTRSAACLKKAPLVLLQNDFYPATICGRLVFIRTQPTVTNSNSGSMASVRVACR